jgi:hypothetical protein
MFYFECKEVFVYSAHCTTDFTIDKLYYLKTDVYFVKQLQASEEKREKYLLLLLMHTEYVYISTSNMW